MAIVDKINALAGSGSGMTIEEALDNLKRNPGSGSGSGDGTVIYELNYYENIDGSVNGYKSVRNASDMVTDFSQGKRVILHCNPCPEGQEHLSSSGADMEAYISMIGVFPGTTDHPDPAIIIAGYNDLHNISNDVPSISSLDHISIDSDGKLVLEYSWN